MELRSPAAVTHHFDGPMGERVEANVDNWLLAAPRANPGMLEMMRLRDRHPVPELVPWAGEFVGKYLISAIAACRMSDNPRLPPFVASVVAELIATQAEDGYLGPFGREERLLGHWDLWGHYHCMLALLMWHEATGDEASLGCARAMADLICDTFPDDGRHVYDAGSHEMNMAVIHSLGWLYRLTGQERYLAVMRQIEADWQRPPAGDYLRTGLSGVEFFRTPKPRWESLHDLQGLIELGQITGDRRYAEAFVRHWESIRNHDRHPSGGFTTGEQAVGNPYSTGAIETCCTIAWMALSVDMLRLTGDASAADELELATWNGMLGAQHPSGRWWTYDTPMDGARAASAHSIVFQARAGTPELNCCSVNGPRGLSMLTQWAAMADDEGAWLNYYGPCFLDLPTLQGGRLLLRQVTDYPAEGNVRIEVAPDKKREMSLRLRIPAWSAQTAVRVNGEAVEGIAPGEYLALRRVWQAGDVVELELDMALRSWTGELGRSGCAALFRGPILLAFDQKLNAIDTDQMPPLDLQNLIFTRVQTAATWPPIVAGTVTAADGTELVLCDFATAGACGTHYRSWLPAEGGAPAPFYLRTPAADAAIAAGPLLFEWSGYRPSARSGRTFTLEIAADPDFSDVVVTREGLTSCSEVLEADLEPGREYTWRVTAVNAHGCTGAANGPRRFTVDPDLPNTVGLRTVQGFGEGELMVAADLEGSADPSYGVLHSSQDVASVPGPAGTAALGFNGRSSKVTYAIDLFPEEDYTAALWLRPEGLPTDRLQEVFSAWACGMDDPLRICLQGEEVFARIEAGAAHGTEGVGLANGRWVHVAAVKQGPELRLYVDGTLRQKATVPHFVFSATRNVGIGCNPNYAGNECLQGALAGFCLYARALGADEIARLAG